MTVKEYRDLKITDKEINRGAAWTQNKIAAGCPGAIAEARETADYLRARLHPVAAKTPQSGRNRP